MKRRFFQCLKKISLPCFAVFACLFSSLFFSTSVSGISVSSQSGFTPSTSSNLTINGSTQINFNNSSVSDSRRYLSTYRSGLTSINRLIISTTGTGVSINGPGILTGSFSFYVTTDSTDSFSNNPVAIRSQPYSYINRDKYNELFSQCEVHLYDPSIKSFVIDCDYSLYVNSNFDLGYFGFAMDIQINNTTSDYYAITIYLQSNTFVQLDYSSLSNSDKQWLLNNLADQIEEGQKAANQDVKDQTETATTDADTSANTQGSAAGTQGQTLLGAFSGFVSAISNVSPASSCSETVDLSGYHQDLVFNVDVCESPFPSQLSFIGTILLILMVVPLSIFTVRRMIGLFRSFQS